MSTDFTEPSASDPDTSDLIRAIPRFDSMTAPASDTYVKPANKGFSLTPLNRASTPLKSKVISDGTVTSLT